MSGRTWTGVILILIGALLLLEAFGVTLPSRWWALLFLIPAALALFAAWRIYNREGAVTPQSAVPFAGGVALILLMLAILADITLTWRIIGPVALIIVGLGILTRRWP